MIKQPYVWLAVAVLTATVAICCAIQPIIAVLLLAVFGFVMYAIYENKKNMPNLEEQEYRRVMTTYECMHRVIEKVADTVGVKTPYEMIDIEGDPFVIIKDGFKFVKCSVLKSSANIKDDETLHNAMRILQVTMNRCLKNGAFNGLVPYSTFDNRLPLFVIDDIKDNGTHLEIEVAIADSKEMCDYLWSKKHRKAPEITVDRSDGEF